MSFHLPLRLRRLRQNENMRRLVRETHLRVDDLIYPLFIKHGLDNPVEIASMPGVKQLGLKHLGEEIRELVGLGIPAVLLFGIPETKDPLGQDAYSADGIIAQAIRTIKEVSSDILVISDLCFCEYTSHGHCGVIHDGSDNVLNDETLDLLVKQALVHVEAGADIIAPSGMMDGMIGALRTGLDEHAYQNIPLLSYAVKYSSALYGPFRDAAEGSPQFGDRKTYQMDIANSDEALREVQCDLDEGADMLMVKPALHYLDIIHKIKSHYPEVPLSAYQVSGEYSMIKAAAAQGYIDEDSVAYESLLSIKRAGADFMITYFAKQVAKTL